MKEGSLKRALESQSWEEVTDDDEQEKTSEEEQKVSLTRL